MGQTYATGERERAEQGGGSVPGTAVHAAYATHGTAAALCERTRPRIACARSYTAMA
jgi:hypothetical protein